MLIIHHRRNRIKELQKTPIHYGVEIDIRSQNDTLILSHDPFSKEAPLFEEWLQHFHHAFLILNVKEEGLEEKILSLLRKRDIKNYFFLDQSFPFLIKTASLGEKRVALRISEFEPLETSFRFVASFLITGSTWIWIDCFHRFWLNEWHIKELKERGFRLCLVSPELQGRHNKKEILQIKSQLKNWDYSIDAVCTKKPSLWLLEELS